MAPAETEKQKRALLPIAIIAVVLLAIAFLWLSGVGEGPGSTRNVSFAGVDVPAAEVADASSAYVADAKKDGFFVVERCGRSACTPVNESASYPQILAWSLMAYAGQYNASGDERYRRLLDDAMSELIGICSPRIERCVPDASVPEACEFVLMQASAAYELSRDERYLAFIKDLGICQSVVWYDNPVPMLGATAAREQFILYRLSKSEPGFRWLGVRENVSAGIAYDYDRFLEQGLARLNHLPSVYNDSYLVYSGDGAEFRQAACWVQLAKLEAYRATDDPAHLREVEGFFGRVRLSEHLADYKEHYAVSDLLPCLESFLLMRDIAGTGNYDGEISALNNHIAEYYLDYPSRELNDGSSGIQSLPHVGSVTQTMKAVSDNSHFVYLLSKQGGATLSMERDVNG